MLWISLSLLTAIPGYISQIPLSLFKRDFSKQKIFLKKITLNKLIFITEARFLSLDDGSIYSLESSFAMPLYQRYLAHFDEILIFARTRKGSSSEVIATNLIFGEQVKVVPLPYYIGFYQFIKTFFKIKNSLKLNLAKYIDTHTVVICRIPGRIGSTAIPILIRKAIPYGLEIVGNPYDLFAKGVIKHPLRIFLRFFSDRSLKRLVLNAPAALYVTKHTLQNRYPCKNLSIGVSDVVIPAEYFVAQSKKAELKSKIRLIAVGSLDQMYKSPDIVLRAIKILEDRGINCLLSWIGDGRYLQEVKSLSRELGTEKRVNFFGKLPSGEPIKTELIKSDIFLQISRTEGLPRALVEAMACGLPCIGTPVGGIPEVLEADALVPVNNPELLADKIQYLINNPTIASQQANRNLLLSYEFEESKLESERKKFYKFLKLLIEKSNDKA